MSDTKENCNEKPPEGKASADVRNEREQWSRKLDYMLSMVGYCVGLGNLWRFPYLCMRNGGGAFLLPFLVCLVICGLPLYFLEVAAGQFAGKGTLHVWAVCPLFKGIGIGMVVLLSVVSVYYNIIIAWSLFYLGSSFKSPLPWTLVDQWKNGSFANVTGNGTILNNSTISNTHSEMVAKSNILEMNTTHSPVTRTELFWQYETLNISPGLHSMGSVQWKLALSFLGAWILVFLCLMKGTKSIGKVVYVTALLPYVLLTVILIRGLTLPGSAQGVLYYLRPDFAKLLDAQVWVEAALQVFYSLGPAWGPLFTMSSYNKFNNNCLRDAVILTFVSEGTSIYGGLTVFSVLGFMSYETNVPISEVVKSGPGLGFVVYPEAISRLPLPNLWAVLFFLMLLTVGLDSQFATVEVVCSVITDSVTSLRHHRVAVTACVCVIFFLIGIPMTTQGGIFIFQLIDWYAAALIIIFGILECVIFAWIYGAKRYSADIEMMLGRSVPLFMKLCWYIITPVALLCCLAFTIVEYKPPVYGSYVYPVYAEGIGWLIAVLPICPLPLYVVWRILRRGDKSVKEVIAYYLKPSTDWKPQSGEHATVYRHVVPDTSAL
ncbi:hypothetical protein ScPMuIL_001221 [Solemya velum]